MVEVHGQTVNSSATRLQVDEVPMGTPSADRPAPRLSGPMQQLSSSRIHSDEQPHLKMALCDYETAHEARPRTLYGSRQCENAYKMRTLQCET